MPTSNPNFIAGGNIKPSRFVKISTAANHTVLASGANEATVGISQQGLRRAPRSDVTETYAAIAGEPVMVYGNGSEALLMIGTGGCTAGQYLKPDADGAGVNVDVFASADGEYGARALETRLVGELARVYVEHGVVNA